MTICASINCLLACSMCKRCGYVSLSLRTKECSWYETCPGYSNVAKLPRPPDFAPDYLTAELLPPHREMLQSEASSRLDSLARRTSKVVNAAPSGANAVANSLAGSDPRGECAALMAAAASVVLTVAISSDALMTATWRMCALVGRSLDDVFPEQFYPREAPRDLSPQVAGFVRTT